MVLATKKKREKAELELAQPKVHKRTHAHTIMTRHQRLAGSLTNREKEREAMRGTHYVTVVILFLPLLSTTRKKGDKNQPLWNNES